jgi:chemotaxis protein methyltransferase CheR
MPDASPSELPSESGTPETSGTDRSLADEGVSEGECIAFLQWALPRLGMRWKGFRKVRRQVCRRIRRRAAELGLGSFEAYRRRLLDDPEEWEALAPLCRVTISRFMRDRGLYAALARSVLPELARAAKDRARSAVRVWSAGCASGEEPYTLSILWRMELADRFPELELRVLGTDVDPVVIDRARAGVYPAGALRELSSDAVSRAFDPDPEGFRLRAPFRRGVRCQVQDLTRTMPAGPFDLLLCRNLVFTYFDVDVQGHLLRGLLRRLEEGGFLAIGAHERLPPGDWPLERHLHAEPVFRRTVG